jgi:heptosyltransferase-2/heptosyltransferase-3
VGTLAPIAIHPGSGAAIKRWRSGAWAELIHALTAPGEPVILTGGGAERELCAAVADCTARPVVDLAGRTDLGTLAALFARCRLVLGPDSGPLHLAVAVGTPTVHLFGPASAERFGPWGSAERHRVVAAELPCAPCGRLDWPDPADHPCVRTLEVARVIGAARGAAG